MTLDWRRDRRRTCDCGRCHPVCSFLCLCHCRNCLPAPSTFAESRHFGAFFQVLAVETCPPLMWFTMCTSHVVPHVHSTSPQACAASCAHDQRAGLQTTVVQTYSHAVVLEQQSEGTRRRMVISLVQFLERLDGWHLQSKACTSCGASCAQHHCHAVDCGA